MANLTVAQRTQIWRGLMRYVSRTPSLTVAGLTKFDLYDPTTDTGAIADTDTWCDTHAGNTSPDTVGLNGALQAPFKTTASAALKTLVSCAVASMRVSPAFARQILGEID